MFANKGAGQFVDVARPAGSDEVRDSRAIAAADFDGDGRLDLAISNNNAGPGLYMNRLNQIGNWMRFKLVGKRSNRDGIGARVTLRAGGKTLFRTVEAGSGFASQAPLDLHFGMGDATAIESLEILWPGGILEQLSSEDLAQMQVNEAYRLVEEEGLVAGKPVAEPRD